MKIVYAGQEAPDTYSKSLFLVGPTPRSPNDLPARLRQHWRAAMLEALYVAGYDGVVFIPEPENGKWPEDYLDQVEWEQKYIEQADLVLAWVPRDLTGMPAFTTNVEFGEILASGKLIYGRPEGAPKTRYLDARYKAVWGREPLSSLEGMAKAAVARLGPGAARTGPERRVPLDQWKTKQFQAWYAAQMGADNRLDDARVLWSFFVGRDKSFLFCFTLWVKVWVASENRHKSNEFIFSRTDISTIVAFYQDETLPKTKIVLVKEFRSPARTRDGFIYELPGGSSFKANEDPLEVASHELEEETNLKIDPSRFTMMESRQVGATLSTHHAVVFAVELTAEEMAQAELLAISGEHFGVETDSEQTYVQVGTLQEIMEDNLCDWATLGMIWQAVYDG